MKTKLSNKETGALGEKFAQEYLAKKGYKIIETNRRFSRLCEIDIIAQDRDTLVFVEVKTRTSDFCGSGLEAITKTKYGHIKIGLFTYLQETKNKHKKFRIDAVSVVLTPSVKISHLKNI